MSTKNKHFAVVGSEVAVACLSHPDFQPVAGARADAEVLSKLGMLDGCDVYVDPLLEPDQKIVVRRALSTWPS